MHTRTRQSVCSRERRGIHCAKTRADAACGSGRAPDLQRAAQVSTLYCPLKEPSARFAATADEPREASSRRCAQAHLHGHAALAQGEHQCSLHVRRMRAVSEARARRDTRVPARASRIHRVRVTPALDSCAHRAITARSARRTSLLRARWRHRCGMCTCCARAAVRTRGRGPERSRPC